MLKDLLTNRLVLAGVALLVLFCAGCLLYLKRFESEIAREELLTSDLVRRWNENNAPPPAETAPSPSTAETTQPSCCESGDALCCNTPGSPCCPPSNIDDSISEQSARSTTSLSEDISDVDTTENISLPLTEGKVVPDHIVEEANRFREWDEKQEVHHKAWVAHNEKDAQLSDDFQRQFAAFLMALPIERRQATFNQMQHQMESQSQDLWDEYATKLYSYGLNFQTEYSPEESDALSKQSHERLTVLSENMLRSAQEGQKFLQTEKELNVESE